MAPGQQLDNTTEYRQNMFASNANSSTGRRDAGDDGAGVLRQGDRNDPPEAAREPAGDAGM